MDVIAVIFVWLESLQVCGIILVMEVVSVLQEGHRSQRQSGPSVLLCSTHINHSVDKLTICTITLVTRWKTNEQRNKVKNSQHYS